MSAVTLPPAAPPITAEEYLKLAPSDRPSELVRGRIVVMNPPFSAHGYWCVQIAGILREYVRAHKLGRVIGNDGGVITERNPDTVRGADVAYYSYERVPRGPLPKGYWPAPELAVEVRSSDDRWKTLVKKTSEYLEAGVLNVVIVEPEKQTVHIYSPDREAEILTIADTLTLPESLPGFSVSVGEIFET
ncbi:MAG: Uma2 family endonuclease [Planctomycetaceae bacterium]|nr:Uma2 family endonuclease [Planctomycetaceae bacterium]